MHKAPTEGKSWGLDLTYVGGWPIWMVVPH